MGMYTEAVLRFEVRKNTSQYRALFQKLIEEVDITEELPFAKDGRLDNLWLLDCDSYYFGGCTICKMDDTAFDTARVTLAFNLKNYQSEIEALLDWLVPACCEEWKTFIGYIRYEEADDPTLVYFADNKVILTSPSEV